MSQNAPITAEETFNKSIEKLWEALTHRETMVQWYFDNIPDFKPEVGFKTEFLIENEGRKFTHLWTVTEVEPKKRITYQWKFKEYPGEGYVTFELFEKGDRTKLKLSNTGIETYPQDIPEFKRESCQGGWHYFINQRLKDFMDG